MSAAKEPEIVHDSFDDSMVGQDRVSIDAKKAVCVLLTPPCMPIIRQTCRRCKGIFSKKRTWCCNEWLSVVTSIHCCWNHFVCSTRIGFSKGRDRWCKVSFSIWKQVIKLVSAPVFYVCVVFSTLWSFLPAACQQLLGVLDGWKRLLWS